MQTPGDPAPDFDLLGPTTDGFGTYRLSAAASEGPVVLVFYEFDFAPTCVETLLAIEEATLWDSVEDLSIFGISGDGPYAHRQFMERLHLSFPLLVDRTGNVAEVFGVLDDGRDGIPLVPRRSLFVVDEDCTVRFAWQLETPGEELPIEDVREAITSL